MRMYIVRSTTHPIHSKSFAVITKLKCFVRQKKHTYSRDCTNCGNTNRGNYTTTTNLSKKLAVSGVAERGCYCCAIFLFSCYSGHLDFFFWCGYFLLFSAYVGAVGHTSIHESFYYLPTHNTHTHGVVFRSEDPTLPTHICSLTTTTTTPHTHTHTVPA